MKSLATLLAAASMIVGLGFVVPAFSEAKKQTLLVVEIDPIVLATGWRATDIIGATVYDDDGKSLGKLEDMIITDAGTVPYAVVSVGGFFGIDAHHVVVAASSMELVNKKLTLRGATIDILKALPNFTFAS
ncbi:PRC-barrel domain-containing protein [Mongoliimonas terrestris]|uniref:PRC-barrel domain-containing protein n=1 Tax=Mongoliimonas terrestris TaxID=1709001 RepID=UPI0009498795|nr:PRC-barrel domain-containing protein [Mongoliimonas terrestris]